MTSVTSVEVSPFHARNRFRAALVLAGALVLVSARTHPVVLAWAVVLVGTYIVTRQVKLGNVSFVALRRGDVLEPAAPRDSVELHDLDARLERALDRLAARDARGSANDAARPRARSHRVFARVSFERGVRARSTCTPVLRISGSASAAAVRGYELVESNAR